jgi:hypothetical protein
LRGWVSCNASRFVCGFLIKIFFVFFSLLKRIDVVLQSEVDGGFIVFAAFIDLAGPIVVGRLVDHIGFRSHLTLSCDFILLRCLSSPLLAFFLRCFWCLCLGPATALAFDEAVLLHLFGNIVVHYH